MEIKTPHHQWTNNGDRVFALRYVSADHKSYGGYQWPNTVGAIVIEKHWNPKAVCGGGFHCWPWGIGIGGGKEPVFVDVVWQVVSYLPQDSVFVDNEKAKVREVRIEYLGSWWGAYAKVEAGKVAWIQHNASGSSSATGAALPQQREREASQPPLENIRPSSVVQPASQHLPLMRLPGLLDPAQCSCSAGMVMVAECATSRRRLLLATASTSRFFAVRSSSE